MMEWKDQENRIKTELEQRRIQPKEELWSQLDKRLGTKESKVSHIWKWGIAAILLLGLLIGGIWSGDNTEGEAKISKTVPSFEISATDKKEKNVASDKETPDTKSVVQNDYSDRESKTPEPFDKTGHPKPPENRQIIAHSSNDKKDKKPEKQEDLPELMEDQLEKQLVLSENKEGLLREKAGESDEVELLLREALYKEFLAEIDAETDSTNIAAYGEKLLQEVNLDLDSEEDRAFRDKIREAIHKGWNKAKSAVAQSIP